MEALRKQEEQVRGTLAAISGAKQLAEQLIAECDEQDAKPTKTGGKAANTAAGAASGG